MNKRIYLVGISILFFVFLTMNVSASFYSPTLNNFMIKTYTVEDTAPVNDTTPPVLYVTNISEDNATAIIRDFNATDNVAIDQFWLSDEVNFSIDNTGIFINNTQLIVNEYYVTVFVNDTSNNTVNETILVNISEELLIPEVNIIYPTNTTYTSLISDLNYSTYCNGYADSCWYSLDGGVTNSSPVSSGTNFTSVPFVEGHNTAIVYCNSTTGLTGQDSVSFTIDLLVRKYYISKNMTNWRNPLRNNPDGLPEQICYKLAGNKEICLDENGVVS